MRRSHLILPAVWLLALSSPVCVHAQFDDEEDEFRQGLVGHYADQSGREFHRVDPSVSFVWEQQSPDVRLGGGAYRVVWKGYLMSQAPGRYQLQACVSGQLRITLNDQVVLDATSPEPAWHASPPLELPFDYHALQVEFVKTATPARVALFWSGPQFQLEPIGSRQLFHDVQASPAAQFERGELLVRALRCAACHEFAGDAELSRAPALDRLADNIDRGWLLDRLGKRHVQNSSAPASSRDRMPGFGFAPEDAAAVADFLLVSSAPSQASRDPAGLAAAPKVNKGTRLGPAAGEELLLTMGCLACHRLGDLGADGLFSGGDLTHIADKRPAGFFQRWLAAPESINRHHRMPIFELSEVESWNLAAYLATLRDDARREASQRSAGAAAVERGGDLVRASRCAGCHELPGSTAESDPFTRTRIDANSRWGQSCLGAADRQRGRPGFELCDADRQAVQGFFAESIGSDSAAGEGSWLLLQNNCLACHARGAEAGLADTANSVAAAHPQLAGLVPGMTPPSLNSIGDKLHDEAIAAAILRQGKPLREYLSVRMPRFRVSEKELQSMIRHFVDADRIPERPQPDAGGSTLNETALQAAGSRLVTTDGFGCTSCHQVGQTMPVKAPLNARGPGLSLLGQRIRRPWFDRFIRNPARIVPRMEMPSVRLAVQGSLDDDLERQLSAVWDVLNKPGFQPPRANAVRIVRRSGATDRQQRAVVITDVVRAAGETYPKPLLIGLPNRHNVLFDLATARLVHWSVGDVARQRTEGKTWFWEAAGTELVASGLRDAELVIERGGQQVPPLRASQFLTEFDSIVHSGGGLVFRHRLHFPTAGAPCVVHVTQEFTPRHRDSSSSGGGFVRTVSVRGVPAGHSVRLRVLGSDLLSARTFSHDGHRISFPRGHMIRIENRAGLSFSQDLSIAAKPAPDAAWSVKLAYLTDQPVDQFPVVASEPSPPEVVTLDVVPGFEVVRLPLAGEMMPTALAWRPGGELMVASLKGRVWSARDRDGDGLEDELRPFSDELAAPYGLAATEDFVDVLNKHGLLRLIDNDHDGRADQTLLAASGWGHTTDYHDWAVGLPADSRGNYYVALPCQQDQRTPAAAKLRGEVIRLVPRQPTADDPRRFDIEPISGGHRFPMGMARSQAGELFVTDNQGNYNPFNELNHVQPGRRYGFINAIERKPGFAPPLTPPAIDIPHPWTRSVNGICFLETPEAVRQQRGSNLFGPFEGHLIGCEYDTRRLIRMSLQQVGQTFQGAAYPFSLDEPSAGPPLLGPLVCSVAPDGDLYVGGIRDSGWGGANNVGELVRLRPESGELPCGIAEVRATRTGFVVHFTSPVDRRLAADVGNYAVASYTRESTPAYGGSDKNRRSETVRSAAVSADGQRVTLKLSELRANYVYEFRLKSLAAVGQPFFPAEAYYTLRTIIE